MIEHRSLFMVALTSTVFGYALGYARRGLAARKAHYAELGRGGP